MNRRHQHAHFKHENARTIGINTKKMPTPKLTQTPMKIFHVTPNPNKSGHFKIFKAFKEIIRKSEKSAMTDTRMSEMLTFQDLDEVIHASWVRFKHLNGRTPLNPSNIKQSINDTNKLTASESSAQTEVVTTRSTESKISTVSCQVTQTTSDKSSITKCRPLQVSIGCTAYPIIVPMNDAQMNTQQINCRDVALGDKHVHQLFTIHTITNSIFGWDQSIKDDNNNNNKNNNNKSISNIPPPTPLNVEKEEVSSPLCRDASVSTLDLFKTRNLACNTTAAATTTTTTSTTQNSLELKDEKTQIRCLDWGAPHPSNDQYKMQGKERFETGLQILCQCNQAVRQEWFQGNSAIHYAVSLGHWDCVNALISSNICDLDIMNRAGYSPAMLASLSPTPLTPDGRDTLRRMFNRVHDINKSNIKTGRQTALMVAVLRRRLDIIELLVAQGADINVKDESGETAITLAQAQNNDEIVSLLEDNFDEFDDDDDGENVNDDEYEVDKNNMCVRLGNITISHKVSNIRKFNENERISLPNDTTPLFF